MSEPHRVLVVEDHEPVARLVSRFLAPHYQVLPFCLTLTAADRTLANQDVGTVILDVRFPEGETSLPRIPLWKAAYPGLLITVRTGFPGSASPMDVIRNGATGYLTKPGKSMQEIVDAIEAGRHGLIHLCEDARQYLKEWPAMRRFDIPLGDQQVTCIQIEFNITEKLAAVAVLKHARLTEHEMGTRLGCSHHAIHARVQRLYDALGIGDELALVILVERALGRAGLIDQRSRM